MHENADWTDDLRQRLDELLDAYRRALLDSLNDLTENEARARRVPSKTTLLGLVNMSPTSKVCGSTKL